MLVVVFVECLGDVCSCAHYDWYHCTCVLLLLEGIYILTFIIIIIIIIIVVDSITLLNIYLPENLLSQNVGGIRLSQGKEIHPIP